MGVELELATLLAIQILGNGFFGHFEERTAPLRKILKWGLVTAATLGLYARFGHAALALPLGLAAAGVAFHFVWCRRHGIHPLHATPRRRYYELRGWAWVE